MKRVLFLAGNIVNFDVTPIRLYNTLSQLSKSLEKPMLIAFVGILLYLKRPADRRIICRKFEEIDINIKILPRFPFLMCIFTTFIVMREKIDIIHAVGHSAVIIGVIVKFLTKVKLVFDIRGTAPEERVAEGIWEKGSIKYRIAKILERKSIEFSDYVIVVSNAFKRHIKSNYKKFFIEVIPCCVDNHKFHFDPEKRETIRRKFHLQNKFVVVYNGSFALWTLACEMAIIFLIFKQKIKNAHFLILTPANKMKISNLMVGYGLLEDDFTIINLSHEEIPTYLLMGDVGLLLRSESIINRVASPVKFTEYLACGIPVLATEGIGDVSHLIRKYRVGGIVDLNNNDSKMTGVDSVLDLMLNERQKLCERCKNIARNYFSLEKYIKKYHDIYIELH